MVVGRVIVSKSDIKVLCTCEYRWYALQAFKRALQVGEVFVALVFFFLNKLTCVDARTPPGCHCNLVFAYSSNSSKCLIVYFNCNYVI